MLAYSYERAAMKTEGKKKKKKSNKNWAALTGE